MIQLDDRTGSKELAKYFTAYGIQPLIRRLEFGDIDFTGLGPRGNCSVVMERKRIDDLIQSMHSQRLSGHQLPGMAERYDYGYLIVEGIWKPGADGELLISQGPGRWIKRNVNAESVMNYVMSLALRAGMIPWRTGSAEETVAFVVAQYKSWQRAWASHKAHDAVYAPSDASGGRGFMLSFQTREVPLSEKILMQFPGVDAKARSLAEFIHSMPNLSFLMHGAHEREWSALEWKDKNGKWKKLGIAAAKKICEVLSA